MDIESRWNINRRKYPNDEATLYYQKNPIKYSFNNYGFRTPDDFNDKDEGNIFLGCSHTMGIGHLLENTWSYKLNEHIGGKFWNLGQGGSGVNTAFRLLYGFKDYLKVKNIFHYAPFFHSYRYEFIINKKPKMWTLHNGPVTIRSLKRDNKRDIRLLNVTDFERSLVDDEAVTLDYDKSIYAIKSLSKEMGCNYYVLTDLEQLFKFEDDNPIKARDFQHYTIGQQNYIYKGFLKKTMEEDICLT